MNYKDFSTFGLNETEAKIYLAILSLGETVVSRIANKSGVKRTTVYLSLHALKAKGLIGQAKKNGQTHYFAEDPRVLERIMKKNNDKFSKLMPEIASIIKLTDHKPSVQYYDGEKNYQKIYNDILSFKNQEVLIWQSGDYIINEISFVDNFHSERLEKKISLKTIFSGTEQDLNNFSNLHKLNKIKFAPINIFHKNTAIYIYKNHKIGIISIKEDLSIIIESEAVHEMLKGIFNLLYLKL